jgi:polyhydroxybutyrate depolymerase
MRRRQKSTVFIVGIVGLFIGMSFQSISGCLLINTYDKINNIYNTPGDYDKFLIVDGWIRSYRFHLPQSYNGEKPVPLVLALHGWPSNSYRMRWACKLDEKSEEEGFIVVYPNGHIILSYIPMSFKNYLNDIKAPWELGWNFWDQDPNPADDVRYIESLIDYFLNHFNINESRVYVTGISGGACMSYRLGAELTSKIAAIAAVAGTIGGVWDVPEPDDSIPPYVIPEPSAPLPVIVFHGTADEAVYYDGGWRHANEKIRIHPYGLSSWIYIISVNESISFWVDHNNCEPIPTIEYSYNNTVIKETYSNGDNDSEVVLYTIVNGEHVWFGSNNEPPSHSFLNDKLWEFFENHPINCIRLH